MFKYALQNCTNLTSITFPSLKTLSDSINSVDYEEEYYKRLYNLKISSNIMNKNEYINLYKIYKDYKKTVLTIEFQNMYSINNDGKGIKS